MLQFGVAKELGMSLSEVRTTMTPEELIAWSAYFQILNEDQERAMERAKRRRSLGSTFLRTIKYDVAALERGLQS